MTIFEKIINGEIPSYKIYEDEYTFAFLDANPWSPGHTLVIPKVAIDYFADVPEPYYSAVFQTAKKIAPAIKQATGCKRVSTMILGFEVPHFHYHLLPMNELSEVDSSRARKASLEELENMHTKIMAALEK